MRRYNGHELRIVKSSPSGASRKSLRVLIIFIFCHGDALLLSAYETPETKSCFNQDLHIRGQANRQKLSVNYMTDNQSDKALRRDIQREAIKMKGADIWDVLSDAINNFSNNGDTNQAAAIALYAILSAIPLFILTVIAAGSFFSSNPTIQNDIVAGIQNFHPYFSEDILRQLGKIEGKGQILGWIGVLGLIWLSAAIFSAVESALNIIFRSQIKRHYIISKLIAFCMIPTAWVIGGFSVIITYVTALFARQPLVLPGYIEISLTMPVQIVLRYIVPFLMVVFLITAIYRIVPTAKIRFRVVFAGSFVFALLVEIAKQFFTWYVAHYTRYNIIFGSLETIVILVIWVFYMALLFLFCAEVMSSYLRRDALLLERALLKPHVSLLKVDERLFKKFGRAFARDEIIFSEGDAGREMFYIISGRVCLERTRGQAKKTLAEMGPGQYFGEMAALIDVRRTARARALENSHLAVINDETFQDLIRQSQDVALALLREFALRLKHSNAALEDSGHLWLSLAASLYCLILAPAPVAQCTRDLSCLTGQELSEIEALLQSFCARGILSVQNGQIQSVNRDKVMSLLSSGSEKEDCLKEDSNPPC